MFLKELMMSYQFKKHNVDSEDRTFILCCFAKETVRVTYFHKTY